MKFAGIVLWLVAGVLAVLITACNGGAVAVEPQVIVVTATPTATPEVVIDDPEPTEEVLVGGGAEPEAEPTAMVFNPGTLLKGSDAGVYYLRNDGTRQHIYDWNTFMAFGFEANDIVKVEDTILEDIPLSGELTRLVRDDRGDLLWIANGRRWNVNEWKPVVNKPTYDGIIVTSLDASVTWASSGCTTLRKGMLLDDGEQVYYFYREKFQSAYIIPVLPAVGYDEFEVMDVPAKVLAVYEQKSHLEQATLKLAPEISEANVRAGKSLEHDIIGTVMGHAVPIVARGRTADGAWLVIDYGSGAGWLAADLVAPTIEMDLLPSETEIADLIRDLPQAQPAAVTETVEKSETNEVVELQPIYCDTAPIRGFGKVWGDHLDVQNTLGCPYGDEQGTKAAVQTFQNGLMLWLEADSRYSSDPVYVFFNDGNYQRFGDLGAADPAKVGETPAGFYPVGDKFSKVYWEGTGVKVKERLGHATGEAGDTAGAFLQFNRGRMFWAEASDSIYVIYDYYECCDANDNSYRIRSWAIFEDEF